MSLPVERCPSPLPLQGEGGDQALDLGGLAVGLAILALEAAPVGVDVLAHIVVLGQVEELPDLGGPLGTAHAGLVVISQPRQISWTYKMPMTIGAQKRYIDNMKYAAVCCV